MKANKVQPIDIRNMSFSPFYVTLLLSNGSYCQIVSYLFHLHGFDYTAYEIFDFWKGLCILPSSCPKVLQQVRHIVPVLFDPYDLII